MANYFSIALIITSIALIASVILQSKGVGLGGFTGGGLDSSGGIYTKRRGIEKVLFWVTIGLSAVFILLTMATVMATGG
ncbi:MAG: preprotein translocase subunit SecG [Chloroflexota bacterium]|nr:preprotein translocase subunit SecG [Chloroflexota bacterium]